jgi:predicted ribosome quality control (RQC) complex YloA/Tae2 family protein
MSGLDVRAVVVELQALLPLWVGKCYQFDEKTVVLRLNGKNRARYQLVIESGRRAHMVEGYPSPPQNPSGFAMYLRKHITGGLVLRFGQRGFERIFFMDVGKKNATIRLFGELFDEGNIILVSEDNTILKPLWHHRFKERSVVPGEHYGNGEKDCGTLSPAEFSRILQASERDIVRTLATDCLLGGVYAEEVCRRAGVPKGVPAQDADAGTVHAAILSVLHDIENDRSPRISASGCWPIAVDNTDVKARFPNYNAALAAYYPAPARGVQEPSGTRVLTREEVIRRQQKDAAAKFEEKIHRMERLVALMYEHYTLVSEVLRSLDAISKTRSWQEIAAVLKKSDDPVARRIRAIHPENATIELDLGQAVTLQVHESVETNAARYYDQIKKFRRKQQGAMMALSRPLPAPSVRAVRRVQEKPRWFQKYRWFMTSDGVLVLGGRDASQNEDLVKKYLGGNDTFVHADVHGASVVIVRGTTAHMDEAVQFAAVYSGAWKVGHGTADVYAVRAEQVTKTPPSGEYLPKGSFMIRGERTYYKNVPLQVAIGLTRPPDVRLIGGPPAAIRPQAQAWVLLSPGKYETNDIARRVTRILRERLSTEEQKGLRSVLSTDRVAALLPPGGADIEEGQ